MPRTAASAASSSGAPRQWNARITSLSSARTRRRRRSSVQDASANSRMRGAHFATSGSSSTFDDPPRSSSAPWLPTYVIEPSETIRRAVVAWRPLTQATRP